MNKSFAILAVCCVAAVASWLPMNGTAADPKPGVHHHHGSACADACASCANSCSSCMRHCAMELASGNKEHATTLQLCNDCADLCSLAAKVESRGGPLNLLICEACAKACDRCALECGRFKDQPHMADCAKSCTACAKACREMIEHAGHAK